MIDLKLDTNAVMSLFPEGSEARLKLQSAVISNVIERTTKSASVDPELKKMIDDGVAAAGKEFMKEYLESQSIFFGNNVAASTLVGQVKARVIELTKKQIEQSIAQEMETYFFKEFKRIQESMLMQLEKTVDRKLEQYTEKQISEQVALRFKKALAAANSLQDPQ
jgi:hypothetical protein